MARCQITSGTGKWGVWLSGEGLSVNSVTHRTRYALFYGYSSYEKVTSGVIITLRF